MMTAKVSLDCNNIRDWDSFHEEFARVFGFPDFYGRNMNAWIGCLTSLDAPEDGMSSVHCEPGSVVFEVGFNPAVRGSLNTGRFPVTDLVHFSETRLWILPCNRCGLPCPYGSDSILDMSVNPSFQAQLVLRSGLAALVSGMFGMGWLGSGLGIAHAFTPIVIILFDVVGILVLGSSIYFIRKGRALRRNYPASSDPRAQRMRKQFVVVVILEFTAIAILSMIAHVIHRPDLAPVLAAIVVGVHFLALGKIFRQARYYFWGIAITLWCVFCAFSFRSNMLVVWSNIGTGVLLWACCAHGLLRARGMVHSLVRKPNVSRTSEI